MQLPGPDYPAPAKLNLFLHVLGRRPDGYHMLQSVFTLIDRADRLRFRVRLDGEVHRVNVVRGVPEQQDLTVRAALLLKEASGSPLGADIEIDKRIPIGGGLGGGSTDAATTLLALDRLWETGFGPDALAELAGSLGADIPFFLFGGAAWAEGTGDELRTIELPPRWYVVLAPPVEVPTREIFQSPELTRNTEPLKMEDFSARPGDRRFHNDLERVVIARYPQVRQHLEWLRKHGEARMTGSGACVFAGFDSREAAESVMRQLPGDMQGFVAHGLERHPLRVQ
ncbi:MAG: 4-(cytidine 5'-diphospho)-2-C-methyl-D-erythritol kinase [Betaproteobacteria bacterium]